MMKGTCFLLRATVAVTFSAMLLGCAGKARLSELDVTGAEPRLASPRQSLIPTVKVPEARGWGEGEAPTPGKGMKVGAFARDLENPRWLYVLPNGDVLVAETNTPESPARYKGIRGWFTRRYMRKAGVMRASANRITLLRDTDADGAADVRTVFLSGLNSPFGMALSGNDFYVANTDALMRFRYVEGDTAIRDSGELVAPLPAGPVNMHWTRSLVLSANGRYAYVGVGSNSDHGERGLEYEEGRAAILEIDLVSGFHTIYASGLRNPVGLAWDDRGRLWTTVNERDEIGSDVPPDYLTGVIPGGFYGWPWTYWGPNADPRVVQRDESSFGVTLIPDYALGAHTAPLGLAFTTRSGLSQEFGTGWYIALHGSWNRKPLSGYRVIFVRYGNGRAQGGPSEVLSGFINARGEASGRPSGVAIDATGALLVADDVGNTVWRVTRVER